MATYYIDPSGSDGGAGTEGDPWQHIYYALDNTSDGDTIICKDGTYDETTNYRTITTSRTIKAENRFGVTVILSGNNTSPPYSHWGLNGAGKILTVEGCIINLVTLPVGRAGIGSDNGTVVCKYDYFYGDKGEAGAVYARDGDARAYKCTFRNLKYGLYRYTGTLYAQDNIIEGCTYGIKFVSGNAVTESYNNFYNNGTDIEGLSIDATDITTDPKFINDYDHAEGYIISLFSDCIDGGIVVSGYIETYEDTAPDMGCQEQAPAYYKISGSVTLAGVGVEGAVIRIILQDDNSYFDETTTDGDGNYLIQSSLLDPNKKYHVITEYKDPVSGSGGTKYQAMSYWDIVPIEVV